MILKLFLLAGIIMLSFMVGILLRVSIVFFLKLMCGSCHGSCREFFKNKYYLIESLTTLLTVLAICRFGITPVTGIVIILIWGLIVLSAIDISHKLLLDIITQPLLWLGLALNSFGLFVSAPIAIVGAILGYLSLATIAIIYQSLRKVEGMGRGDFKLLAMWGAWLGAYPLIWIILLASFLASIIAGIKIFYAWQRVNDPMAFGPYLAFAGLAVMFYLYPSPIFRLVT